MVVRRINMVFSYFFQATMGIVLALLIGAVPVFLIFRRGRR